MQMEEWACLGERVDMSHFYDFHHRNGQLCRWLPVDDFLSITAS
jgi:hypothetical protein